jgi:hypothetical protein
VLDPTSESFESSRRRALGVTGDLVDLIVGAFVDLMVGALVDLMVGALVDLMVGALVDLMVGALVDLVDSCRSSANWSDSVEQERPGESIAWIFFF